MGLEGYGLDAGLPRRSACCCRRATRSRRSGCKAARLFVLRRGKVVSRMAPAEAMLSLEGRPERTGFAISGR